MLECSHLFGQCDLASVAAGFWSCTMTMSPHTYIVKLIIPLTSVFVITNAQRIINLPQKPFSRKLLAPIQQMLSLFIPPQPIAEREWWGTCREIELYFSITYSVQSSTCGQEWFCVGFQGWYCFCVNAGSKMDVIIYEFKVLTVNSDSGSHVANAITVFDDRRYFVMCSFTIRLIRFAYLSSLKKVKLGIERQGEASCWRWALVFHTVRSIALYMRYWVGKSISASVYVNRCPSYSVFNICF